VILQDVKVPAANLLGEIGKGHKVAFNVLNFGRFKLGAGCSGGAQCAIGESATYAAERRQFGQPIASFGAIRHKIGEMIARAYAVESLVYRTAGLIDARIGATPHDADDGSAALAALEEYAIEASIAKVAGSETLNFVLDENIQIHGGNGYVRDYPAERHFRDARVNRIFEGTNEINRLLIPGMLARRAVKGTLPIIAAAKALQDELLGPAPPAVPDDSPLAAERLAIAAFKKTALMVLGLAMQTYGEGLADQQEVMMLCADILIDVFSAESATLRAEAALQAIGPRASLHVDAARIFVNDAAMRVESSARQALAAMAEGDTLRRCPAPATVKGRADQHRPCWRRIADKAVRTAGKSSDGCIRRVGGGLAKSPRRSTRSHKIPGSPALPATGSMPTSLLSSPCACRMQQQAADDPKATSRKSLVWAANEFNTASNSLFPRTAAQSSSWHDRSGLQGRNLVDAVERQHDRQDGDIDGRTGPVSPRRHVRVQPQGPGAQAHGLSRSGRTRGHAVRAVHGFDYRQRDLLRWTIPGAPAERDRHLRDRLQPGVLSVLLLQHHLRVPDTPRETTCRSRCARVSVRRRKKPKVSVAVIRAVIFDFDG
jgi:alkylation response protein AidB-like acyl-CoA dehydrogenase